jgi:putative ABC transport system permease protein
MLRHYVTTALRNLLKNKVYAAINILGLALGMACCMLVILFVHKEFRYDQHVDHTDRIYRVIREIHKKGDNPYYSDSMLGQLAPALESEYPEIDRTTRFYQRWTLISLDDQGFMQYLNPGRS